MARSIKKGPFVQASLLKKIETMKSDEAGKLRKKLTELNKVPRDKRDAKTRTEIASERAISTPRGGGPRVAPAAARDRSLRASRGPRPGRAQSLLLPRPA